MSSFSEGFIAGFSVARRIPDQGYREQEIAEQAERHLHDYIQWEWQCPVCENWRTGETCHTCGTKEKESRHHREKR